MVNKQKYQQKVELGTENLEFVKMLIQHIRIVTTDANRQGEEEISVEIYRACKSLTNCLERVARKSGVNVSDLATLNLRTGKFRRHIGRVSNIDKKNMRDARIRSH